LEDLLRLRDLVPGKLRLNMVYHEGTPIAGSLLFLCNPKVVLCFYNMLLYEYEHLKPIYLVMHETCRWAVENGYEWVDIGVSQDTTSDDPMTPSLGLINFKERFDARGILRSTYHLKV
jgi:lipid II:glycine glycyltransferase (peptidoglycan interpeptide bridge formation enzyme)